MCPDRQNMNKAPRALFQDNSPVKFAKIMKDIRGEMLIFQGQDLEQL